MPYLTSWGEIVRNGITTSEDINVFKTLDDTYCQIAFQNCWIYLSCLQQFMRNQFHCILPALDMWAFKYFLNILGKSMCYFCFNFHILVTNKVECF